MGCSVEKRLYFPRHGGSIAGNRPHIVVLAGPNGAGKSTAAPWLLKGALGVTEFVNADDIAKGLSAFDPEGVAISAGKIMLRRLADLAAVRASFAFETTLATRTFAPWLGQLATSGYAVHVLFLYLPDAEMAVARVAKRVAQGGHSVPDETIRRRYRNGLRNFFGLYRPVATTWRMYNAGTRPPYRLIARSFETGAIRVQDTALWTELERQHGNP